MIASRKRTKIVGVLSPNKLYTTEGALRFGGLGETSLYEARQSGKVKAIERGRRVYYRGSELIAWIIGEAK